MRKNHLTNKQKKQLLTVFMTTGMLTQTFLSSGTVLAADSVNTVDPSVSEVKGQSKPMMKGTLTASDATVGYGIFWNDMVAKAVTKVKATDASGKDETNGVTITGTVDTNKSGDYKIVLTSPSGLQKEVVITVQEAPMKGTLTASNATVGYGIFWNDMVAKVVTKVKATDANGKDETDSVTIRGTVDTKKSGNYKVIFISPSGLEKEVVVTVPAAPLTVNYIDEFGHVLADTEILNGKNGERYETKAKTIEGYRLKEMPANVTGTFTDQEQTVTYIYEKDVDGTLTASDATVGYGIIWNDMIAKAVTKVKATDANGKDETDDVTIRGTVDTKKSGNYKIVFTSPSGLEKEVTITVP